MNQQLRELFPITKHSIYLNHAAVSPPPTPTIEAVESQLRDVSEYGSLNYRKWLAVREEARRLVASMIGAQREQVAFLRNTSDGLSTVANGLTWQPGDNIVSFRGEFPSNVYPWLRIRDTMGVEVRFCGERDGRIDLAEFINLIDSRTRVVAISHVQYASGFRADLERLGKAARTYNALLIADVAQSLGVIPIDVGGELIDVAAAPAHKWLLTPEGVGLLYLSNRARERIQPTLVGWTSVPHPEDYSNFDQGWNVGTLGWETGTMPTALMFGLKASLAFLTETGVTRIASYLEELTDYLCERLRRTDYEIASSREKDDKSQIVSIRHSRSGITPMYLYSYLKDRKVITAPRGNRLRISPHFYNNHEEMDRFIAHLP